jgi:hypothetical protein
MLLQESSRIFRSRAHDPRSSTQPGPRPEEDLSAMIAGYRHLYGGGVRTTDALARARRAYLVLGVVSLLFWLLIGYAIFRLVAAAG